MTTFQFPSEVIRHAFMKFQDTLSPELQSNLNGRLERGLSIAHSGGVASDDEDSLPEHQNRFRVRSSDPTKPPYLVDLQERSCTCPDHWKGHYCKHRIAANIIKAAILASRAAPPAPPRTPTQEAVPQTEVNTSSDNPVQLSNSNGLNEAIVWGVVRLNGQLLGVEVLSIGDEQVTVRALPKIIEGKKLQPQFPFEGKHTTATFPKQELFHVKVFQ